MTKNNENIYCNHNTCRPASCNKFRAPMHGHKHGFHHAPGFGFHRFNNVPAYGFTGRPTGCHAHGPMNGFDRRPANGFGCGPKNFHSYGPMHGFHHAPAYGFAGRPTGCHAHGPMNGFNHGPANGFGCGPKNFHAHGPMHGFHHAPAYGFAGKPTGCHAHDPMNGFNHGPANHCGNGRPFFKGCTAPEFHFFRTDIRTTETGYLLEAELPGFKKDEIAVDLEGRNLKITAKKAEPAETKEGENACPDKAKRSGTYCRVFRLNGIRTEDVTASYEDGILRVDLPKKERPAPEKKSITIH